MPRDDPKTAVLYGLAQHKWARGPGPGPGPFMQPVGWHGLVEDVQGLGLI